MGMKKEREKERDREGEREREREREGRGGECWGVGWGGGGGERERMRDMRGDAQLHFGSRNLKKSVSNRVTPELFCPISFFISYDIGQNSSGATICLYGQAEDKYG